ncbi:MAG: DUF4293 domain-containing protein [Bacteroidales bacterium]|jgi:O-antigen ligase|nr:DUF4293 domain-containing protein [Bacteroidales bacterium]
MIQRIQTLWLIAVLVIAVATFFFPLAYLDIDIKGMSAKYEYSIYPMAKDTIFHPAWVLIILQSVLFIATLITIFLYKNRMLQIKILAFLLLVCVVYTGYIFLFVIDNAAKDIPVGLFKTGDAYGIGSYFSFAQIVLIYLAQKAIKKDEILVRSSDRLR